MYFCSILRWNPYQTWFRMCNTTTFYSCYDHYDDYYDDYDYDYFLTPFLGGRVCRRKRRHPSWRNQLNWIPLTGWWMTQCIIACFETTQKKRHSPKITHFFLASILRWNPYQTWFRLISFWNSSLIRISSFKRRNKKNKHLRGK